MRKAAKRIRCAIVGYGGAFNMGRGHANWINQVPGMETVAVCDLDKERLKVAQQELPGVRTYTSLPSLLKDRDVDLCVLITPHNLHAKQAVMCANAGKHVVTEKPMCLTVAEADAMIAAAKKHRVTLTVFHNRRHDGDFLAMRDVIRKGIIGDVFQVETGGGGYGHPGKWWRANKRISGGAFYDWGAHIVDWCLHLVPSKIESVTGVFQKRVWMDVTNEDHILALIRFANGATAEIQMSNLAAAPRPRWRILGTKGAILDEGGGKSFKVTGFMDGVRATGEVAYYKDDWADYYKNLGAHLLHGAPLEVTPESARRVIGVMETAEKSWKSGKAEKVPHE
jgi:predicted dehydrogenase